MSFDRKQLDDTLSRLIDRDLSEIEFRALEELLVKSPEARAHYYEYMRLHLSLDTRHRLPVQSLTGASVISMDEVIKREKRRQFRISTGIAAAIVVLLALVLGLRTLQETPPTLSFETAPGTMFTLTHDGSADVEEGTILEKGSRLRISQGTVELRFISGVKSVIEAPADMTLHEDNTLYIRRGTAWFEVPQQAVGFKVKTPNMEVIDLGTEFGVITHKDEQDEIHVFTGKVKVTTLRGAKQEAILTAGHARTVKPGGRLAVSTIASKQFRRSLPNNLPYLHWSFDEVADGSFPAYGNMPGVEHSVARPKSVSISSLRSEGKFGKCVSFNGKNGQELVTGHPGFDPRTPLTICYWVKLPDHKTNHIPLLGWAMPDQPEKAASKYARWEFHAISAPGKPDNWNHRASCAGWSQGVANLADGKWHHITTVFTGKILKDNRPELQLYVDAIPDPVTFSKFDRIYSYTDYTGHYASQPIVIGASGLSASNKTRTVSTSQLDEIFIIQGALNERQIKELMENNQLQSP